MNDNWQEYVRQEIAGGDPVEAYRDLMTPFTEVSATVKEAAGFAARAFFDHFLEELHESGELTRDNASVAFQIVYGELKALDWASLAEACIDPEDLLSDESDESDDSETEAGE